MNEASHSISPCFISSCPCPGSPTCRCLTGFTGPNCNLHTCKDYCKNGGNCTVSAGNQPTCRCPADFLGDQCQYSKCSLHQHDMQLEKWQLHLLRQTIEDQNSEVENSENSQSTCTMCAICAICATWRVSRLLHVNKRSMGSLKFINHFWENECPLKVWKSLTHDFMRYYIILVFKLFPYNLIVKNLVYLWWWNENQSDIWCDQRFILIIFSFGLIYSSELFSFPADLRLVVWLFSVDFIANYDCLVSSKCVVEYSLEWWQGL